VPESVTVPDDPQSLRLAIVGRGRLGRAFAAAFAAAGAQIQGPLGRGEMVRAEVDAVLLCVPERELAAAAALVPKGPLLGHCSASAPLSLLEPHERFSIHPLMTVTAAGATFTGAACAVDGSTTRAVDVAVTLATRVGMVPLRVPAERRALYHAAASIAANFLVTLESAAEQLARECGIDRAQLAPLVRAAVSNWETQGFDAITGPLARGDKATVAAQRAAVADSASELLPLWDALAARTRAMLERAS